jgi:hypothetical protein
VKEEFAKYTKNVAGAVLALLLLFQHGSSEYQH